MRGRKHLATSSRMGASFRASKVNARSLFMFVMCFLASAEGMGVQHVLVDDLGCNI